MNLKSFFWPNTSEPQPAIPAPNPGPRFTNDDYENAALSDLYPKLKSAGWWPAARQYRQQAILAQRVRAEAMADPKWRRAYIHWVEYFQKDLDDDNRRDAEWAASKPERDADERKRQAEKAKAELLRQLNPPDGKVSQG